MRINVSKLSSTCYYQSNNSKMSRQLALALSVLLKETTSELTCLFSIVHSIPLLLNVNNREVQTCKY